MREGNDLLAQARDRCRGEVLAQVGTVVLHNRSKAYSTASEVRGAEAAVLVPGSIQ